MVFMNMGGPSTTDEVGNFLSRLFVRAPTEAHSLYWTPTADQVNILNRPMET